MTDFLDEILSASSLIERDVTYAGKTGTIYLKRLTAGQKLALVKGKKYNFQQGAEVQTIEVDLEDNERAQQMTVQFCVCNADGSPRFKKLDDVQKLDSLLLAVLYKAAADANRGAEEDGAGEA